MGTIHVYRYVLQCEKKSETSSRKHVKQTQGLEKCTHIYSKNVIYNWQNFSNRQGPVAHKHTHTQLIDTYAHSFPLLQIKTQTSHTHTYMYDRHMWFDIAVGIKSALTSNVSVMHTVGPNN